MNPTRNVSLTSARLALVLPGTWSAIPLDDDPNHADAIVSALVKRQVGRDDRLAGVRRQVREQLQDVVAQARTAGAFQLALALEIMPGIPFSAAMVFHLEPWEGPGADALGDRLVALLPGSELLDLEPGAVARAWRQTSIRPGTETIPDTKLEYLTQAPDGSLLRIVADCPVECDPELLVALFDAIVDSIRWVETDDVER